MKMLIESKIGSSSSSNELCNDCLGWRSFMGTHLLIHAGTAQLILDHHNNNAEHSHDEGIVADALSLLEERFSTAESIADIRLLLAAFVLRSGGSFIDAATQTSLLHVPVVDDTK